MARASEAAPAGVARMTVAERVALGKAARKRAPRSSHAAFDPGADRADPIELLEQQAESRVPELVPIRYGRMLVSAFTFYRGAARVMASDLAGTPRSGLTAQCCGDAHLSNFGVFASPERRLVFDLNDFDETAPGAWEWDVKRLAASMTLAARDNGFAAGDQEKIVLDTVSSYRLAMAEFADMPNLAVWYARIDIDEVMTEFGPQLSARQVRRTDKALAKARTRDSMKAFSKLTREVDGRPRIVSDPPLITPLDDFGGSVEAQRTRDSLEAMLRAYRETLEPDRRALLEQFELVDVARKVVGVGSVGTRAWIALLLGRDGKDPLFLQIKEAEASVLEGLEHAPGGSAGEHDNHGQRVVAGQRLMQASSDIFLGWLRIGVALDGKARDFYVRQLKDWKGSAETGQMEPSGMANYGRMCGWTLARAHARSGDRIAIAAYLGNGSNFDRAIAEFARRYSDQTERDYQALRDAVRSGRIHAETGV